MKKLFLFITALALCVNTSVAQEKNSISLSYGFLSLEQAAYSFGTALLGAASGPKRGADMSLSLMGPFVLSYHRTMENNQRFSLGGSLVLFDQGKITHKDDGDIVGFNAFTLAPEAKFKYLNSGNKFNLYGLLGAGVTVLQSKDYEDRSNDKSAVHFNLQVTPLGIEYGGNVKGFAELGFGYKGILNVGVNFGF